MPLAAGLAAVALGIGIYVVVRRTATSPTGLAPGGDSATQDLQQRLNMVGARLVANGLWTVDTGIALMRYGTAAGLSAAQVAALQANHIPSAIAAVTSSVPYTGPQIEITGAT